MFLFFFIYSPQIGVIFFGWFMFFVSRNYIYWLLYHFFCFASTGVVQFQTDDSMGL